MLPGNEGHASVDCCPQEAGGAPTSSEGGYGINLCPSCAPSPTPCWPCCAGGRTGCAWPLPALTRVHGARMSFVVCGTNAYAVASSAWGVSPQVLRPCGATCQAHKQLEAADTC